MSATKKEKTDKTEERNEQKKNGGSMAVEHQNEKNDLVGKQKIEQKGARVQCQKH